VLQRFGFAASVAAPDFESATARLRDETFDLVVVPLQDVEPMELAALEREARRVESTFIIGTAPRADSELINLGDAVGGERVPVVPARPARPVGRGSTAHPPGADRGGTRDVHRVHSAKEGSQHNRRAQHRVRPRPPEPRRPRRPRRPRGERRRTSG
jgi:hypothetical protein